MSGEDRPFRDWSTWALWVALALCVIGLAAAVVGLVGSVVEAFK